MTSRPSGTSGCRRPSRSTSTIRSPRRSTSPTRRRSRRRREGLPPGLRARDQGHHDLPRRLRAPSRSSTRRRPKRRSSRQETADDPCPSITDKIKTGFGNLYVTISYLQQQTLRGLRQHREERLLDDGRRRGPRPPHLPGPAERRRTQEVIYQLKGIGGAEPIFTEGGLVQSIPDAIAKVLERHLGEVKENPEGLLQERLQDVRRDACPTRSARPAPTAAGTSAPKSGTQYKFPNYFLVLLHLVWAGDLDGMG